MHALKANLLWTYRSCQALSWGHTSAAMHAKKLGLTLCDLHLNAMQNSAAFIVWHRISVIMLVLAGCRHKQEFAGKHIKALVPDQQKGIMAVKGGLMNAASYKRHEQAHIHRHSCWHVFHHCSFDMITPLH